MTTDEPIFEDDPVLGQYIAHYPSNRLRLLIIAGGILLVVWFVVTVTLWQVEETTAAIMTVVILAITTLLAGWYVTHLWNREVVLYERGFSYREGSNLAFIRYQDVTTIRQRGERIAYFGGLVKRNTLQFTMITEQSEVITLNSLYKRLEELTLRLERAIMQPKYEQAEAQLREGDSIDFGAVLRVTPDGIALDEQVLPWADYAGYDVQDGAFILHARQGGDWGRVPLTELDNALLLVMLLRQRIHRLDNAT